MTDLLALRMETYGVRSFKEARQKLGLKQKQLADMWGVTLATIGNQERGDALAKYMYALVYLLEKKASDEQRRQYLDLIRARRSEAETIISACASVAEPSLVAPVVEKAIRQLADCASFERLFAQSPS